MWRTACVVWAIAIANGCGGGSNNPPGDDAAPPDAEPDAEVFTPTRITVFDRGPDPLPDTLVHFVAPDLTIREVTTDAQGVAEASTPPGSTVIVFLTDGVSPTVKIFANTQPGDSIHSGRVRPQAFAPLGGVTFQLPSFPAAQSYRLHVSCTNPALSPQPQLTVQPLSCPDATMAEAVGWALDAAGNAISGPSVLRDFALQAGTTIQMGAYDDSAVITKQSSFTNFPAGATQARWVERFFIGTDVLSAEGSVSVPATQMTLVSTVDWSASTMSFKPSGFGVVRVDEIQTSNSTSPFVVDAGDLLRGIRNPSYDGTAKVVEWEEASSGQSATLVSARLSLTNSDRLLSIELHAPYDPSLKIALPPLPAELSFGPAETVVVRLTTHAAPGRTYGEMLSVVDTDTAFTLPFFVPAFTGRVFEASD